ncbi:ANTAR domain-containing protein [Actinomycetospora cinnamomea]|uniref:ANTAR domain-containing protein n=1 Tax=Actinomycetospora cinnamomea TaxID=663609 RepID=UPI00140227B2|nr:ANTAR domain-containing protein [Actinomycetospora cinnamomea]
MTEGPVAWLTALLAGAVFAIDGADVGSVVGLSSEGARTWAATLPVAEDLDRRGVEWGEGPGADALRGRTPPGTVTVTPLDEVATRRWPRWSARARSVGIAATLSVVLPGGSPKRPAVLVVHGPDTSSFGASSVSAARAFAAPVAVAVQATARVAGLERALENRDVIGRAKGLLMARGGVDDEEAFGQLVAVSQRRNLRLAEVAAEIVERHSARRPAPHPAPGPTPDATPRPGPRPAPPASRRAG